MKTVLIVDDSKVFQKVVERILSPHFQIVGKGSSGIEGFDLYKSLKPNLVIMDITMPNCSGKECLKNIMSFDPKAKVIMVSSIGDDQTVKECLDLGAKGFLPKDRISTAELEKSKLVELAVEVLNGQLLEKVA